MSYLLPKESRSLTESRLIKLMFCIGRKIRNLQHLYFTKIRRLQYVVKCNVLAYHEQSPHLHYHHHECRSCQSKKSEIFFFVWAFPLLTHLCLYSIASSILFLWLSCVNKHVYLCVSVSSFCFYVGSVSSDCFVLFWFVCFRFVVLYYHSLDAYFLSNKRQKCGRFERGKKDLRN